MKSVLISIQPYWVFLIIAQKMGWNIGEVKTIEVRKNRPKDKNWDNIVKIYCSKDKKSFSQIPKEYQPLMERFLGKVIGEFICNEITVAEYGNYCVLSKSKTMIDELDLLDYANEKTIYGWHISNLVIYDEPRELGEFYQYCGDNPKCDGCEAHYYSNTECGLEDYCYSIIYGCKPLKRPFQSWGYVYEVDITDAAKLVLWEVRDEK